MPCEKHKLRKRKDCPDCFAPEVSISMAGEMYVPTDDQEVFPGSDLTIGTLKKMGFKTCEDIPQIHSIGDHIWDTEPPAQHRFDEKDYIKDLIDRTVRESATKIRAELSDLRTISWEHLDIPIGTFSIALMYALGTEGWVYKDTFRGEIAKVSGLKEEAVIMTRVKSDKWPARPDFTKRNTIKKYLEKPL